jgi:hypothetical protein
MIAQAAYCTIPGGTNDIDCGGNTIPQRSSS